MKKVVAGPYSIALPTSRIERHLAQYAMIADNPGMAFIFVNSQFDVPNIQIQSEDDSKTNCERLHKSLKLLGYEVKKFQDLKLKEIFHVLEDVSSMDHSKTMSLFVAVLTCGQDGENIYARDRGYHISKIWKLFTGDRCHALNGKPKIFLTQAYVAKDLDVKIETDGFGPFRLPKHADFLFLFSTTRFIGEFCNELDANQRKPEPHDLLALCARVVRNVKGRSKQELPCVVSTTTRLILFDNVCNVKSSHIIPMDSVQVPNEDFYLMNHRYRGKALVFVHTFETSTKYKLRKGSREDLAALKETFTRLDFDVNEYVDKKRAEVIEILKQVALIDHSNSDCLLVAVSTHGDDDGIIYADDKPYNVSDLWQPFTAESCPTLDGKPKVFIIQACRGCKVDPANEEDLDEETRLSMPTEADFLFAFANVPGYLSFRSKQNGSWFIQELCMELNKYGQEYDLLTMLTFVVQRVAYCYESNCREYPMVHQKKQMPCIASKLTKFIVFNRIFMSYQSRSTNLTT